MKVFTMRNLPMSALVLIAGAVLSGSPALAQTQSTTPSRTGCTAGATAPATPESKSADSGTAPGNSGSTGFSGSGLGGAYTGTTPNGPVASSPSVQPATAKGLDPMAAPPKADSTGKC